MSIPPYIEERIRRLPPEGHCIVPQSTPVVSFGDATTARVATLGLNPSSAEFEMATNELLPDAKRRLATLPWLGTHSLQHASYGAIVKVFNECNHYFDSNHNPLRSWFDRLAAPLSVFEASYYDGSACHLDIVQWSTNPKWGDLRIRHPNAAKRLVMQDVEFLRTQLFECRNIETLLINGSGALSIFQKYFDANINQIQYFDGLSKHPCKIFKGSLHGRIKIIAWSVNRQAPFSGVQRGYDQELCRRIAAL